MEDIDINLHPYYINKYFQSSFVWEFDLSLKYELLSKYCFPDLTAGELRELLPDIEWKTIVKLSLFYTPIMESAGQFQPLSLYYKSLKNGFSNPEHFIDSLLKDKISYKDAVILSVIANIYKREHIYDVIVKNTLTNSHIISSLLYKQPFEDYSEDAIKIIVDTCLDMVGISNLDICIIIESLPRTSIANDVQSGMRGNVTNLYSLYGAILSYNDERIANLLGLSLMDNHISLGKQNIYPSTKLIDDNDIYDRIHTYAHSLSAYLSSNIIYSIPTPILESIYSSLNTKARNILGCYKPDLFDVVNNSSYFTSESYLQYITHGISFVVDDNSVRNEIATIGYPL